MTTFNDREHAFEQAYAKDEEIRFRVHSRCAKMLAAWAAQEQGLSGANADTFVRQALVHDMKKSGIDDLIEYVHQALTQQGKTLSLKDVQAKTQEFLKKAKAEVMAG